MEQIKYLLIGIIFSFAISSSLQCSYKSCHDPQNSGRFIEHTMCLYPTMALGDKCNDGHIVKLSEVDKQHIVNLHNELRAKVASGTELQGSNGPQPAGKIGPLQWDDELAEIAQHWMNQCINDHDKCRNITSNGNWVGQNLYMMGSSENSKNTQDIMTDSINSWYDEVKDFDNRFVSKFEFHHESVTGHYTQLVWADTTHVGCGMVQYKNSGFYMTLFACNYSPGGNVLALGARYLDGRIIQLTEAERQHILRLHNLLRAKVASGTELRGPTGAQPAKTNVTQKLLTTWIDGWYQEVKDVDSRLVYKFEFHYMPMIGHYSTIGLGQNYSYWMWLIKYKSF
ncbi:hypothetical protein PV325_000293, partial [Microctonus aethiopoides]